MAYDRRIYEAGLPHRAIAVYLYLRDRANKDGLCYPAIGTIARELSLSDSTVKRAIGDQWYKGELVDRECEFERRYTLTEPIVKAKPRNEEIYLARLSVENEMKANMGNHYRVTPSNAKYNFEWHKPSEEYSCLYNYPKNIKEDWLALLRECESMLIEEGIIHSMNVGENTAEAQETGYGMSLNP